MKSKRIGSVADLPAGTVIGVGRYAVGNAGGKYFAVTRRCRHLYADLANGSIDRDGCLVCPWHASKYDVKTGRMVRGPQGIFAKIPGLDAAFIALTKVLPLGRTRVVERDGSLFLESGGSGGGADAE
jgi:nitrite reductase/ring-hydroxylating ferredoxin subunit